MAEQPYLNVSHLPGRKRMALQIVEGNTVRALAYFQRDEDAETFMRLARKGLRYEADEFDGEGE